MKKGLISILVLIFISGVVFGYTNAEIKSRLQDTHSLDWRTMIEVIDNVSDSTAASTYTASQTFNDGVKTIWGTDSDIDALYDETTDDDFELTVNTDASGITVDVAGGNASGEQFDVAAYASTWTIDSSQNFAVEGGSFKVGNGSPDVSMNGEDAYVEGTFEVDGKATFDGEMDVDAKVEYDNIVWSTAATSTQEADTSYTMSASDSGVLFKLDSSGGAQTITLPSTTVGYTFRFVVETGGNSINFSPQSSDKVVGAKLSGTDNKDMILASPSPGDTLVLVADGADGYYVQKAVGTFTEES